jgi:hypothetical protein
MEWMRMNASGGPSSGGPDFKKLDKWGLHGAADGILTMIGRFEK